jgi:hypothetical protein
MTSRCAHDGRVVQRHPAPRGVARDAKEDERGVVIATELAVAGHPPQRSRRLISREALSFPKSCD